MKLVEPITYKCKFIDIKYRQSEVGKQKVYRELPFFQNPIIFWRHNAQCRRISVQIKICFWVPMRYEYNRWA